MTWKQRRRQAAAYHAWQDGRQYPHTIWTDVDFTPICYRDEE